MNRHDWLKALCVVVTFFKAVSSLFILSLCFDPQMISSTINLRSGHYALETESYLFYKNISAKKAIFYA